MTFKKSLLTATLLTVAGLTAVSSANAELTKSTTGTFQVSMIVEKSCTVVAGDPIALSATADATENTIGSSTFNVACSLDTPYTIAMLPTTGSTNEGGTGTGTLKSLTPGTNAATLDYQLTTDELGANIWVMGVGGEETTGGKGKGTGTATPFTVYANVTGDTTAVLPDTYTDIVTVSVAY